jgi:hypothetical protein
METPLLQKDRWRTLIEEQEKSGLSVSTFCKERGLKLAQMYCYRHKFKKRNSGIKTTISKKLVPIKIKPKHDAGVLSEELRLILSNGIQCVLSSHTSMTQIKQLVEVLLSC